MEQAHLDVLPNRRRALARQPPNIASQHVNPSLFPFPQRLIESVHVKTIMQDPEQKARIIAGQRALPRTRGTKLSTRARAGGLQDIEMRLFHPLKSMLATPASDLADIARTMPGEFFVEDKFDGIRAQAHVQDGASRSSQGRLMKSRLAFPELHAPLAELPTDAILDGEIITARGAEILPFSDLQKTFGP